MILRHRPVTVSAALAALVLSATPALAGSAGATEPLLPPDVTDGGRSIRGATPDAEDAAPELVAEFDGQDASVAPGDADRGRGRIGAPTTDGVTPESGVPAAFTLELVAPDGEVLATQAVTAADDGSFDTTVPGRATRTPARQDGADHARRTRHRRDVRAAAHRRRGRRRRRPRGRRRPAAREQLRLRGRLGEARRRLRLADLRAQPRGQRGRGRHRHPHRPPRYVDHRRAQRRRQRLRRSRQHRDVDDPLRPGRQRRRAVADPAHRRVRREVDRAGAHPRVARPLHHRRPPRRRHAAGHRHQPRPARHPAGCAVRHRPVRRPPVPGGARGLLRPRLPDLATPAPSSATRSTPPASRARRSTSSRR